MMKMRSEAWLLRGISSLPGELRLKNGVLLFETNCGVGTMWPWQLRKLERVLAAPGFAATVEDGKDAIAFRWPVAEIEAWCPWIYFGGGIKLRRGNVTLRFSFGRPANTQPNLGSSGSPLALPQAVENLSEIGVMRKRGAAWKAALADASAAAADPERRRENRSS
jgi:hypothetical protein